MHFRRLSLAISVFLLIISQSELSKSAGWLTMETPHFRITFEEGQESFAQEAAYYLEQSHEKISELLAYEPAGKTEMLLADMSDAPNGFATSYYGYNKEYFLMVYGNPNFTLSSGIDTWIYTLAIHEYTHTLHLDMASGFPATLRAIFGRFGGPNTLAVPHLTVPNQWLPQYLIEGFASYMETINTSGGRLNGSLWEMMMRADFTSGKPMSRAQASGKYHYSRYVGDAPYYMYGAYFCDYIARVYGRVKLMEIMQENAKGSALLISGTFQRVIGKSLSEVWQDFEAEAAATFEAQKAQIEAAGISATTRLTTTGEDARNPVYSPDGSRIAYLQGGSKRISAIRLVNADGSDNRSLVTVDPISTAMGDSFSWFPDGSKVIFGGHEYVGRRLLSDLFVYDFKREEKKQLTFGLRAFGPTVSPDGQSIIFISHSNTLESSLMIMDADGKNVRTLLKGQNEMQFNSARYSPDGQKIAVSVGSFGGYGDIYTVNVDGSGLTALTQDKAHDYSPTWSPDGKYILFNSDRSGVHSIYAYETATGQFFQITNVLFGAFSPAVAPSGQKIAFVNYDVGGYDIHEIGFDPAAWKPVALEKAELPTPPDYASFAKEFEIKPYSPYRTLFPKLWEPIVSNTFLGGLTRGQDLLGRTTIAAMAGVSIAGVPYGELYLSRALTGESVTSSEPAPPLLDLTLTPAAITGGLSVPILSSIYSSRSFRVEGTLGRLGFTSDGPDGVPIEGARINLSYSTSSSGGSDILRTFVNGQSGVFAIFTRDGIAWGVSSTRSMSAVLNGDLQLDLQSTASSSDLSVGQYAAITFTLVYIEQQLGTWPIYFERLRVLVYGGGSISLTGAFSNYFGARIIMPTYLWYSAKIEPSVGFVMDTNGNIQFTWDIGL